MVTQVKPQVKLDGKFVGQVKPQVKSQDQKYFKSSLKSSHMVKNLVKSSLKSSRRVKILVKSSRDQVKSVNFFWSSYQVKSSSQAACPPLVRRVGRSGGCGGQDGVRVRISDSERPVL